MKLLRPALGFLTVMTLALTPAVSPVGPFVDVAQASTCTPVEKTVSGDGSFGVTGNEYRLVVFREGNGCSWTVPSGVKSVSFLSVGGGGAGGSAAWGGGGGAGEVVVYSNFGTTPGQSLSITVGNGGQSGSTDINTTKVGNSLSTAGGTSSVSDGSITVTAAGGGRGASYSYSGNTTVPSFAAGGSGGSGGGASEASTTAGATGGSSTASSSVNRVAYGNAGGDSWLGGSRAGAGGGGAGQVGVSVVQSTNVAGGAGGAGTTAVSGWLAAMSSLMDSTWVTATTNGSDRVIAGGGGGGAQTTAGSGGLGGGGLGGIQSRLSGSAGVPNTGSGGGGASYLNGTGGSGGAGGSGIVVIRYLVQTGEILRLDATHPTSYAGSGGSWADISGAGNNATISGATWDSRQKLFTFDGSNDSVDLGNLNFDFSNGFSIHAVADLGATTPAWERIVDIGTSTDSDYIVFARLNQDSNLTVQVRSGSNPAWTCSSNTGAIVSGVHAYSVVVDGSDGSCEFFTDGVSKGGTTNGATLALPAAQFDDSFLARSNLGNDFTEGSIQSVIIYNTAQQTPACKPAESTFAGNGSSGEDGVAYKVLAFTTVGNCSWTVPSGVSQADVLVVGGGGGGGSRHAGGGGAGELVKVTDYPLDISSISISVGLGGLGSADSSTAASQGGTSEFKNPSGGAGLRALGGGGGQYGPGGNGGSGAGGSGTAGGGSGVSSTQEEFDGSATTATSHVTSGVTGARESDGSRDFWAGGGGGGALSAGSRPTPLSGNDITSVALARGGNGGPGLEISWLPNSIFDALKVGEQGSSGLTFAGGGGGGMGADGVAGGSGGVGGGGAGYKVTALTATNGLSTSGGGGGGSGYDDIPIGTANGPAGGNGGSGVVVVRYSLGPAAPSISSVSASDSAATVTFSAPSHTAGSSITDYEYSLNSGSWTSFGTAVAGTQSITGLNNSISYSIRVRAVNGNGDGIASSAATVSPALTPSFGAVSGTSDGFTVQISNYSASYTWSGSATNGGSVTISGSGLVTVSGLEPGEQSTVTISTTRSAYFPGSATVSGTAALVVDLDAANSSSYPGTGSTWTSLVGGGSYTISNGSFSSQNGGAIQFDGSSTSVLLGQPLNAGTDYTFEAWVFDTATSGPRNIISSNDSPLYISGTELRGGVADSFSLVRSSGFPNNVWRHVVLTFDDSANTMALYINGSQVNINSGVTGSFTKQNIYVGAHSGADGLNPVSFWQGLIAKARVYNGALSSQEVTNRYDATKTPYALNAALTPTLGTPTRTADGFTVEISNFDANFTWSGSATAGGSVSIDGGTGVATVSGVSAGASSTLTVTTSRTGYEGGSATATASALESALTPAFGTPSGTADGFTVQISNYDANFTWSASATAGATVSVSGSGLVTVSGLASSTSSTVTVSTSRTGYSGGSATVTSTSLTPYTIVYAAGDDGSGSTRSTTKIHGSALTLPNSATANSYFTRAGWELVGWSTNPDGSTTDYALGASYTANSGITLYPVWNRASYTFSFDNNHSGSSSTITYYSGDTITLPSPTRLGYRLNGWYTAASGGTKVGDAGATYSPLTSNGLILRYELDDPTSYGGSGTTVTDTSSEVNSSISGAKNATAVGGPAFSVSDGMYLEFDGSNDYLVTENLSDRVSGADVSLFAWIYPTGTGVIVTELGQTAISPLPSTLIGWHDSQIEVVGSNLKFALWGGQANPISTPVTLNTWQYVGITYSGITMRAYVDGTEVGSRTFARSAPKANGNGVHYGLGASDTTNLGDGTYGNFRLGSFHVYDSGLTASQVLDNYQATCARFDNSCTQRTLYAQWQVQDFAITFSSGDNASGSDETQTKTFGVDYTIPNSATSNGFFSRAGYSITSWASNSDGTGSTYAFGATYSTDAALTLYPVWTPDTYTITFNKGTASGANGVNRSVTKTHDSALTLPNLASPNMPYFTKTGYTITGWSTSADGSTSDFALGASYTTEADATLYPVWTPDTYTVTYNYNGATGGNSTSTSSYTVDSIVVSLPNPTKTGYTFGGWYSDDNTFSNSVGAAGASYAPSGDVTIYAKWTAATFTVVYEYNGATAGNSTTDDDYTTGGTAITLPTPTRDGYTFGGWYAEAGLSTSVGAAGASYSPTSNRTIYAKWTAVSRSVTYASTNKTGGSAPTDSDTYIIGDTVVVKGNTGLLVRTGYTFAGWTVASDGSGTLLNAGSTLTVSTSNITLYPKWSPATFTITYHPNGGAGTLSKTSDSYTTLGTSVTLPTTVSVSKTGYTFAGWALTPTGSTVSSPFTTTSDVTLYARWTIKDISYTFGKGVDGAGSSLSAYGFSAFPADDMDPYGTSVTLPSTDQEIDVNGDSVTDHQFGGWSDGTSIFDAGDPYILGDADVSFVAQWIRVYSVRYVLAGGSLYGADQLTDSECVGSNDTCTDGQTITLNRTPTRAGYTFLGWEDQSGQLKAARASTAISSSSYIFTAKWDAIDYSVSFDSAGGSISIPLSSTNNIGDLITLPSPGTKTGYTLSGWEDSSGVLYAVGTAYRMGASSESFEAQWIPDVYAVTYDWQGGASSTPKVSDSYTVGTGNMSLPTASANGYTRDGYTFSGWSTSPSGSLETAFQPAADDVLYAIWADGNYTLSYNPSGGTIGSGTGTVPRTSTITLPTPVRDSFTFVGWYDAASGGNLLGAGGASFTPNASQTLYARWVQDSLYGVDLATLETANTYTASNSTSTDTTINHGPSNSSARVQIPIGALPNGTVVTVRYFKDTERQADLIPGDNTYFFSLLVSWLYGSGNSATVPDTATGKPITVTLTNSNIKAGAMVYQVIGETVTELGRATVDGSVTVELTEDPELVVAATKPDAPTSVSGSAGDTRATVSWTAGGSGGQPITGYTVTASPGGATCVTASTSCTISSLTNNTAYTFTVRATNAIGTSVASTASSAVTPVGANYTVTFDSNGGSSVSAGSFFSGSTVSAPSSPSRAGYTFQGWSTVLDDDSSEVTFPYAPGVTQAITLYALWEVAPASSSNRNPRAATPTIPTRPNLPIVVPPRATPQVVATPGPLEAPVIIPSAPPAPNKPTQASVGGRSVEVRTIQEGDSVKLSAGRVEVGVSVPTPSATSTVRPNAATSQPEIVVSPGDTARVDARGLLPGSSVQVWLPGADERELSRATVGPDGSVRADVSLVAPRGEKPIPIGPQVLQVTGFDEQGNQTVIDMTITIVQGAPAPELNREANALPDLQPGQTLATSAGSPEVVYVRADTDTREVSISTNEWSFKVSVPEESGTVSAADEQAPTIRLIQARTAEVNGEGFQPDTRVDVFLFSEPTLLGSFTVKADGTFDAEVFLDARFAVVGDHTLQIQGVGTDGYVKAANLGVLVEEPPAPTTASQASLMLWWVLSIFVAPALVLVVLVLIRRRAA